VLADLVAGSHDWAATLKAAKNPMLILGQGALRRPDGAAILALARVLAERSGMIREGWNGFNVLHTAAARVGGLDLGLVPSAGGRDLGAILAGCQSGDVEVVYLLGADEIDMRRLGTAFVIYQGHHGDAGARRADVVLPGAAYTEKDATYINTEGRVQLGRRAVFPPGDAREDWKILRALSAAVGHKLPYDSLAQLRKRMLQANPVFAAVDEIVPAAWGGFGREGAIDPAPFAYPIADFYRTDPISRASPTMAACAAAHSAADQQKTGTHG
jgi:NADH-quinone oxidoreductase subunit G